jgi:hypothetical protein
VELTTENRDPLDDACIAVATEEETQAIRDAQQALREAAALENAPAAVLEAALLAHRGYYLDAILLLDAALASHPDDVAAAALRERLAEASLYPSETP